MCPKVSCTDNRGRRRGVPQHWTVRRQTVKVVLSHRSARAGRSIALLIAVLGLNSSSTRAALVTAGIAMVVTIVLAPRAVAQDATALVRGRVAGTTGVLADVRVVAQSATLTLDRETRTDRDGFYVLPDLPAGRYVITFMRDGLVTVRHVTQASALESVTVDATMTEVQNSDDFIRVSLDRQPFPRPPAAADLRQRPTLDWLPGAPHVVNALTHAPWPVTAPLSDVRLAINGTPVRFLQPHGLAPLLNPGYAAIEDLTVLAAGAPIAVAHPGSGVISIAARSGLDRLNGGFTATLSNTDDQSIGIARARSASGYGGSLEGAGGIPLNGRRTWLHASARESVTHPESAARLSPILWTERSTDRFWDVTATHALNNRHRVRAGLFRGERRLDDALPIGAVSIEEPTAADDRRESHQLLSTSYTGVMGSSLFLTARVAHEGWRAESERTAPNGVPALWDRQTGATAGASGTCDGCALDDRSSTSWNVTVRRPFTLIGDSHLVSIGVDRSSGGIAPPEGAAGTGSIDLLAARFVTDANGQVYPVLEPNGSSWIVVRRGAFPLLEHRSVGVFVGDEWRPRSNVTVRAGVRWDRQELERPHAGLVPLERTGISPRAHVAWQPRAHGWTVFAGVSRYDADLLSLVGDRLMPPGDWFAYSGPRINAGEDVITTSSATTLALASLAQSNASPLFSGVDATWSALAERRRFGLAPTLEWTTGASGKLPTGINVRADFVWRAKSPSGRAAIPEIPAQIFEQPGNVDLGVLTRRYAGLTVQGFYELGMQARVGGSYTLSRLSGHHSDAAEESLVATWAAPEGDLTGDHRHRLTFWGELALLESETHGTLALSLLQTLESGEPYGLVSWIDTGQGVLPYYFTARDAFHTPRSLRTDLATRYMRLMPGTVRAELVLQFQVVNLFGQERLSDPAALTIARTAFTDPGTYSAFNPFVDDPTRGVHWDLDPRLTGVGDTFMRTMPRAYRVSAGIRF